MWYKLLSALVFLVLLSVPAYAKRECKLERYATLPVTMQHMDPLVKGTINGKHALFEVDSGAFFSTLTYASAKKFGIPLRTLRMTITGASGPIRAWAGTAKHLSLDGFADGLVLHDVDFVVGKYATGDGSVGSLGQNFLSHADTEYDLANGVIRLFIVRGCRHSFLAYWAPNKALVAVMYIHRLSRENTHIVGTARLNGKKIRVLFDTGSPYSTLTLKAAKRVGIKLQNKGVVDAGQTRGLSQSRTEVWIARFKSLDFNGEVIKNARLRVSNMDIGGNDLLLGADFFLSHRIFVSRSQHRIYFTYNGGPVFDLRGVNVRAKLAKAASSGGSSSQKGPAEDTNAASMKRRAMALADRHEYVEALADFDALIKQEPDDADNYLQRGLAHLGNKQPKLALSDMDQALKIKPHLTKALVARGKIRLAMGNDAGARVDFDAAVLSAPKDSSVRLEIANAYGAANKFDAVIAQLDAWIAANPKGDQMPFALTQRCLARALANKQLKLALDDCKSARWKVRDDSHLLASLALVYMRLGKYHKAVKYYRKSTNLQPKSAWVLYGLGIAEERDGSKAAGAKSIRSALALNPKIAKSYKKIGLQPLTQAGSSSRVASP